MNSTVFMIFVSIFFCTIVLAPAASAANFSKSSNTLNTVESNATIQLNVETFHLNQEDSWVRPYFIILNGCTGSWDVSGYTFSELNDRVYGEYYHDSGVIFPTYYLPIYTNYTCSKHVMGYISRGNYYGQIWIRPDGSDVPYEYYEIHTTFSSQNGSQTTIKKIN